MDTNEVFDSEGNVVETETVPRPVSRDVHDDIVATWKVRRTSLIAAYAALNTVAPDLVAADAAVQAATTEQMPAAVKQLSAANLDALAAIKDALAATMGAMGAIEQAMGYMDYTMKEMQG